MQYMNSSIGRWFSTIHDHFYILYFLFVLKQKCFKGSVSFVCGHRRCTLSIRLWCQTGSEAIYGGLSKRGGSMSPPGGFIRSCLRNDNSSEGQQIHTLSLLISRFFSSVGLSISILDIRATLKIWLIAILLCVLSATDRQVKDSETVKCEISLRTSEDPLKLGIHHLRQISSVSASNLCATKTVWK